MKKLTIYVPLTFVFSCLLLHAVYADSQRTVNFQGFLTNDQGEAVVLNTLIQLFPMAISMSAVTTQIV
ncbi:membrane protein [Candidatus Magnetomorum sp. HK-1]|nr:membrane protein [Candidatus Magnetomorum sp. HK-1]